MKNIYKVMGLTVLSSSLIYASGWRLPESSSRSTALSGAYIANSHGADATYYNPANMSFNKNVSEFEIGIMSVTTPAMKYKDTRSAAQNANYYDGDSEKLNSLIPSLFLTSKDYGNGIRYGFSVTVPGGLTRKWDEAYQKTFAQEFSLKILEFNPTMSYAISDNFSVGGGVRVLKSSGVVKSDGQIATGVTATRDLEGSTVEYGYNVALAYKPTNTSNLSVTYRSNIDLNEEGNAKLYLNGTKLYDGDASVSVPLPAALSVAYSFALGSTTIEIEADRTYWSAYKDLDFEYDDGINTGNAQFDAILTAAFDTPKERDWKDTDAFRLGLTHKFSDSFTGMLGFSKDGNPIPQKAYSFESPDYNSRTYSCGFDIALSDDSSIGVGYLYSEKDDRTVNNKTSTGATYLSGEISDVKAHLVSLDYRMSF